ncbi:ABC transporter permease subunit [Nocardia sp. R6R-6]|uniref:ABC transporter permease subunit n=1 Tax=Nocardia sp. R6R-6 TaxID=3459303 RepID=UPI00403E035C
MITTGTNREVSAEAPAASPTRATLTARLRSIAEAYALLIMLVVIGALFTVLPATSDTFLTAANMRILVSNQVVPAIVAMAALLPLTVREFDMSVGAIAGLSAIFVASMLGASVGVPVAVIVGILLGALVGIINATLVTRAMVNGVIATLGTSAVVAGAVQQKTGGQAVAGNMPDGFTNFGSANVLGVPWVAWALIAIAIVVYFVLEHTPYGRQLQAFGSNPTAAGLVGLRTRLLVGSAFVFAAVLAGVAGVIQVARAGGADPTVGPSFTLTGLAAAFLSAAAVRPGTFNVGGTVVAVFFLAVLNNGLSLAGAPPHVANYVNGGALIIGVALATFLWRRRST